MAKIITLTPKVMKVAFGGIMVDVLEDASLAEQPQTDAAGQITVPAILQFAMKTAQIQSALIRELVARGILEKVIDEKSEASALDAVDPTKI